MDVAHHDALDAEVPLGRSLKCSRRRSFRGTDADGYRSRFCSSGGFGVAVTVLFAICIALLAVIAFSGATHDVATDGVYMSELNKQDQASISVGRSLQHSEDCGVRRVGLAGRCLAGRFRWVEGTYSSPPRGYPACMDDDADIGGGDVAAWFLRTCACRHRAVLPHPAPSARETGRLVAVIKDFLKKHIWYHIAFIILYRLAEGFVMKIVPLSLEGGAFRQVAWGPNEQQIGLYYGTYGAAAAWGHCCVNNVAITFRTGIAADAVLSVLHLQSAFLWRIPCLPCTSRKAGC